METPTIEQYIEGSFSLIRNLESAKNNEIAFMAWSGIKKNPKDDRLTFTIDDLLKVINRMMGSDGITKKMLELIIEVSLNGCAPIAQRARILNKKKGIKVMTYFYHDGRG